MGAGWSVASRVTAVEIQPHYGAFSFLKITYAILAQVMAQENMLGGRQRDEAPGSLASTWHGRESTLDAASNRKLTRAETRKRRAAWAFALSAIALSAVYTQLANRSSWFTSTTEEEVTTRPTPRFRLGSLEWRVDEYEASPELQPFRAEFQRHCPGLKGVAAAMCVSGTLSRQFPFGDSTGEFFDSKFDPTQHLQRHLEGTPGHCVHRSAMLAGELLAAGIPARVIQLHPVGGSGHTLVEVWDERFEWALVDPSFGGVIGNGQRPTSARELLHSPTSATWFMLGSAPPPTSLARPVRGKNPDPRLFGGRVFYPEPWLYLRLGRKTAPWPFRGSFAYYRVGGWNLILVHNLLRLGIVACSLGCLASLLVATHGNRRPKLSA